MPYRRFSPRMGRRSGKVRPRVTTFKKIIYHAAASIGASTKNDFDLVVGVDNISPKQTTNLDADVPTGAIITDIYIMFAAANLVSIASFMAMTVQQVLANQAGTVNPLAMGGDPQRNQIFKTAFRCIGKDQNFNYALHFKIPPKYQRVREGMRWRFTTNCNTIRTEALQAVYKFQT